MKEIKFSHEYYKMPAGLRTSVLKHRIIAVDFVCLDRLPSEFLKYDTGFWNGKKTEHYKLDFNEALLIVIFSYDIEGGSGRLWTTIRRWTSQKEKYYKGLVGQEVKVVIG